MIGKEDLRLGRKVRYGDDRREATVEMICWEWVGLKVEGHGYVIAEWCDVYGEE